MVTNNPQIATNMKLEWIKFIFAFITTLRVFLDLGLSLCLWNKYKSGKLFWIPERPTICAILAIVFSINIVLTILVHCAGRIKKKIWYISSMSSIALTILTVENSLTSHMPKLSGLAALAWSLWIFHMWAALSYMQAKKGTRQEDINQANESELESMSSRNGDQA